MADTFDDQDESLISFDEDDYSVLTTLDEEDVADDDYGVCFISENVPDSDIQEAFENGFGLSFTTEKTKRVVESKKSKATLSCSITFSPAVISLAVRWARARKKHFFDDSFNTVKIFAQELGYPVLGFLRLRGWWLSRDDKRHTLKIEYRRVKECLRLSEGHQAATVKYHRLSALLDRLYMLLHDNKRMMLSAKIGVDDHTLEAGNKPSSIRRRKQDALLSFHERQSFQSKLNFEQQHVQIGISLIQFVIVPLLPKKVANDETTVLGWYFDVFGGFKKRKDFVEALMEMCIAFPTVQAVNLLLPKITDWMKQPGAFISQVRRYVQSKRKTTEQFGRECDKLINEAFTQSSMSHGTRSPNKNHLIMKRRVCSLKLSFEKPNSVGKAAIGKAVKEPKRVPTKRHHPATKVVPKPGKPKRRKTLPHCAPLDSADSDDSATDAITSQIEDQPPVRYQYQLHFPTFPVLYP
jgi:hypothetical protein